MHTMSLGKLATSERDSVMRCIFILSLSILPSSFCVRVGGFEVFQKLLATQYSC
jgi:hypothetical protein